MFVNLCLCFGLSIVSNHQIIWQLSHLSQMLNLIIKSISELMPYPVPYVHLAQNLCWMVPCVTGYWETAPPFTRGYQSASHDQRRWVECSGPQMWALFEYFFSQCWKFLFQFLVWRTKLLECGEQNLILKPKYNQNILFQMLILVILNIRA